ncbi:MAG: flavin reductase family protein [bacterium]|nr:flavin reductase family protein [bacterium]
MNLSALYCISYGLYIVGSLKEGKFNGQIANTVFQVTSEPVQIAICLNKQNLTYEYVKQSGFFSLSVLGQDTPMPFIGTFGFKSGRNIEKFKDVRFRTGKTGVPVVLDHTLAYMECEVTGEFRDAGSHDLIVGRLVDADILAQGEPMTYTYYHQVKKGLSPKTAPTYINTGKT